MKKTTRKRTPILTMNEGYMKKLIREELVRKAYVEGRLTESDIKKMVDAGQLDEGFFDTLKAMAGVAKDAGVAAGKKVGAAAQAGAAKVGAGVDAARQKVAAGVEKAKDAYGKKLEGILREKLSAMLDKSVKEFIPQVENALTKQGWDPAGAKSSAIVVVQNTLKSVIDQLDKQFESMIPE